VRGERNRGPKVFENYECVARNVTPRVAVENVDKRAPGFREEEFYLRQLRRRHRQDHHTVFVAGLPLGILDAWRTNPSLDSAALEAGRAFLDHSPERAVGLGHSQPVFRAVQMVSPRRVLWL